MPHTFWCIPRFGRILECSLTESCGILKIRQDSTESWDTQESIVKYPKIRRSLRILFYGIFKIRQDSTGSWDTQDLYSSILRFGGILGYPRSIVKYPKIRRNLGIQSYGIFKIRQDSTESWDTQKSIVKYPKIWRNLGIQSYGILRNLQDSARFDRILGYPRIYS